MTPQIRVLFVDNQVDAREWLAENLRQTYELEVDCAKNGSEALARVQAAQGNYDVVLMDLRLDAGLNGIEVMKKIQLAHPDIEVIIITGFASVEDGVQAMKQGACNYVVKPLNDEELIVYIRSAADRRRFRQERDWLQNILSVSQATTQTLDPEEIAREICQRVAGHIPHLKLFYIAYHDESRDEAKFLWAVNAEARIELQPRSLSDPDGWGLAGHVIKTGQTLFVSSPDEEENLRLIRLSALGEPTRACISIPLISRGKIIGVLSAQSRQSGVFTQDHLRLMQAITNQTAVAIDNAIQHQQTARRLEILSRLYKTLAALRTEFRLTDVLNLIVDNLQALFQLNTCTVGLFDKYLVKVNFVVTRGLDGRVVERRLKDFPPDLRERIFDNSNPIEILDLDKRPDLRAILVKQDLKSFALLPLHGKKEPLGIVTMGSKTELVLSDEQQDLLRALADQAAIAIENAKLHEETEAWAQQLDRLDQIAHDIANELEITRLLPVVATGASELLQAAGSGVYLLTEDKQQFRLAAATGQMGDFEGIYIPVEKGVVGYVLRYKKPFRVGEYWQWPDRLEILDDKKQTAVMGVPIFSGTEMLGVLVVHDVTDGREFSNAEVDLLSRIGHLAGIEIEKAGILYKNKKLLEEREATSDVTQALVSMLHYDRLLDTILENLHQHFGYTTCAVFLKDLKTNELYIEGASQYPEEIVSTRRIKIDGIKGVTAWVARNGKPKIVSDVDKESLYIRSALGSRSEIAVPLIYRSKTIGVLNVESKELNAFGDRDLRILTQAAASIAIAITNARLYDQVANKTRALDRLNEVGKAITSTLNLDQVLDKIARYGQELLNAEVCAVFHVHRKGFLSLEANAGSPPGSFHIGQELEIKSGKNAGLTGYLAAIGEMVNLHGEQLSQHLAIKLHKPHDYMPSGHTYSLLAIPLKLRVGDVEEVIGLIKAENKKSRTGQADPREAFDERDELILKMLASYAETALRNAQLFDQGSALQEVSKAVNSTMVLDEVLETALARLRPLLPFDAASIQLRFTDSLKVVASEGFEGGAKQSSYPHDPQFPHYEVVTSKQPVLLEDIQQSNYRHFWEQTQFHQNGDTRTWLGIPLLQGTKVIGVLSVESRQPRAYNYEHKELGVAFASQIVSAIVNARWLKSAQGLDLLGEIQDISKRLPLEEVLQRIVNEAVKKDGPIGADIVTIRLYDADKGSLRPPAVYAGRLNHPEFLSRPLGPESVIHHLLKTKEPLIADEITPSHLFDGPFVKREGIVSAAGFPLLLGEEPVGVMFINHLTPHSFAMLELALMNLFAQLAAIAIRNAHEHQIVNERLEAATSTAGLLAAMAAWAHDAAGATFSLRADVKNLTGQFAQQSSPDPEIRKILERIRFTAEKVATLIPHMPTNFNHMELVEIDQILQQVLGQHESELQQRRIAVQIQLDGRELVRANKHALSIVCENLIHNALGHLPDGGRLFLWSYIKQHRVCVEITDTGPGIPPEIQGDLFKRVVSVGTRAGIGIGLLLCRIFLLQCKGDIKLKCSDSQGTTFVFDLPLAQNVGSNGTGGCHA